MEPSEELKVLFVELLGEGTECYRPVIVRALEEGVFKILELPEYSLVEERWAAEPGSLVRAQLTRTFSGDEILVAVPANHEHSGDDQ